MTTLTYLLSVGQCLMFYYGLATAAQLGEGVYSYDSLCFESNHSMLIGLVISL